MHVTQIVVQRTDVLVAISDLRIEQFRLLLRGLVHQLQLPGVALSSRQTPSTDSQTLQTQTADVGQLEESRRRLVRSDQNAEIEHDVANVHHLLQELLLQVTSCQSLHSPTSDTPTRASSQEAAACCWTEWRSAAETALRSPRRVGCSTAD